MQTGIHYDRLQKTLHLAQNLGKAFPFPFSSQFALAPSYDPSPVLDLDLPEYIRCELDDDSVPPSMHDALKSVISKLQIQYHHAFEHAYTQAPQKLAMNKLGVVMQDLFCSHALPDVMKPYLKAKKAYADRIARQLEARRLAEERERPQFNANHIPLLTVIYTHHTPYPTAAERFAIAEYTHMSERQVEVWFQNHRRKEKKAGFPPSRARGPSEGVEALLASLPSPSYSQPTPEPERHPDEDPEKKYLSLTRPAFPGPPSSDLIPVPTPPNEGKGKEVPPSFLRPVPYPAHAFRFDVPWPRPASTTPTTKPPPPTMDALTDMFAHMNVHSPTQDSEGEAATARYTTDLRGRSAAYVGEGAWQSWSWSWQGRTGLLSVEWGWGTRRKTRGASWKPYLKPQQLPRRTPSSSPLRRTPSSGSSSSSSSGRAPSWGSQTEAPHSPASSYTSYSPSPSPPPGFVSVT